MKAEKAVFLDKDGTLILDVPYNVDPALIVLADHCLRGLKQLQDQGYLLVVVSNQTGVALGYFKEAALMAVEQQIKTLLGDAGISLSGFYYCPHHAEDNCDCRKPAPGLLVHAAAELNIDLGVSWMIGDILNDIEAGNAAGCKSILIDNGNETEWHMNEFRSPLTKTQTIDEAADYILETDGKQLAGV
jgi:D-glycero-D-manno-heptose 1,7-bisphosphate phosphatase